MEDPRVCKLMQLLPCVLLISACNGSKANNIAATEKETPHSASAASTSADLPFKLGINLSTINTWDQNRPFRNLIYGASWQQQSPAGAYEEIPATSLDVNGWVKSIPAGYHVVRSLSVPSVGGAFTCRYEGSGPLVVQGLGVSDVSQTAGITTFKLKAMNPQTQPPQLSYKLDTANYIRNIDCREADAAKDEALAPEFLSQLSGFKVLRFLNWQTATAANTTITWSSRNKPGDADYLQRDGVPVELIVETANKVDADPWVTIPWNADDDYVARFATYVRDNLTAGHQVYVEVSNEVWNGSYPVSAQACAEAKLEGLPGINGAQACSLERYSEKTKQVMSIWSTAFAGQMDRLVRVASFNHGATYWSDAMLGYKDLHESVDALATAPYFGNEFADGSGLNQIYSLLDSKVDDAVATGIQQKAIARKYGLRYLAYEGGQHIVLANNVPLLEQVERDPRMYDVYKRYLTAWRNRIGDNLNLYNHVGSISRYGAWGLSEYASQPSSQAPKLRAVREFLGLPASPPIVQSPVQVSLTDPR